MPASNVLNLAMIKFYLIFVEFNSALQNSNFPSKKI